MMVKDTAGTEFNAATNGKANAGLTLGIIGTALGGLAAGRNNNGWGNNGLLGGLFGNNNADVVPVPVPAPVTEHQYYEDSIRDMRWYMGNEMCQQRDYYKDSMCEQRRYYEDTVSNQKDFFEYAQGVSQRICDLEQRVAVDETSIAKNFEFMANENSWQNKFFDEKMRYADLLEQCRIEQATCKCIKGDVYASPSTIADPYIGRPMVLGSSPATFVTGGYAIGYNDGCGFGNGYGFGYNNGCGNGYGYYGNGWGRSNGCDCGCNSGYGF